MWQLATCRHSLLQETWFYFVLWNSSFSKRTVKKKKKLASFLLKLWKVKANLMYMKMTSLLYKSIYDYQRLMPNPVQGHIGSSAYHSSHYTRAKHSLDQSAAGHCRAAEKQQPLIILPAVNSKWFSDCGRETKGFKENPRTEGDVCAVCLYVWLLYILYYKIPHLKGHSDTSTPKLLHNSSNRRSFMLPSIFFLLSLLYTSLYRFPCCCSSSSSSSSSSPSSLSTSEVLPLWQPWRLSSSELCVACRAGHTDCCH